MSALWSCYGSCLISLPDQSKSIRLLIPAFPFKRFNTALPSISDKPHERISILRSSPFTFACHFKTDYHIWVRLKKNNLLYGANRRQSQSMQSCICPNILDNIRFREKATNKRVEDFSLIISRLNNMRVNILRRVKSH